MDLASLREMKRAGRKIVGVVVWDYQMAQIVDRAWVDKSLKEKGYKV